MVQSKIFLLKYYSLCKTNIEIVQNSKSKPKKFSVLCTFKWRMKILLEKAVYKRRSGLHTLARQNLLHKHFICNCQNVTKSVVAAAAVVRENVECSPPPSWLLMIIKISWWKSSGSKVENSFLKMPLPHSFTMMKMIVQSSQYFNIIFVSRAPVVLLLSVAMEFHMQPLSRVFGCPFALAQMTVVLTSLCNLERKKIGQFCWKMAVVVAKKASRFWAINYLSCFHTPSQSEMEFLDITLKQKPQVFCSMLFTFPSTGGF